MVVIWKCLRPQQENFFLPKNLVLFRKFQPQYRDPCSLPSICFLFLVCFPFHSPLPSHSFIVSSFLLSPKGHKGDWSLISWLWENKAVCEWEWSETDFQSSTLLTNTFRFEMTESLEPGRSLGCGWSSVGKQHCVRLPFLLYFLCYVPEVKGPTQPEWVQNVQLTS